MEIEKVRDFLKAVLQNMPVDWLELTTHRLDIYNEDLAKTEFLEQFEALYQEDNSGVIALKALPTAYDYIRLGHPLSSILEWALAKINRVPAENVISFQSNTVPVFSILRKNLLEKKSTQILYTSELPKSFDADLLREVYGYNFTLKKVNVEALPEFNGSTILYSEEIVLGDFLIPNGVDFYIAGFGQLGSILTVNAQSDKNNNTYISEIQHVRRRETVAMTPNNSLIALRMLLKESAEKMASNKLEDKKKVIEEIKKVTGTTITPLVASSGLSMQYAIMMGAIDYAFENHPDQNISFIVPPNCYGGTNDQARRVAACSDRVEIVDLLVDGENDMVESLERILQQMAQKNSVPYIIAEIPTNPRVEVPDLHQLQKVLGTVRQTENGDKAVAPIFILDQTFCPDFHFLGMGKILSGVPALAYASGSKFPSGGRCTAGYCVSNTLVQDLMSKIALHLQLCDNEATDLQYHILAAQLPSMKKRILDAYKNTREFVTFIHDTLPGAKINFVSEELAAQGFTPSVFSLDLPTWGNTPQERESNKRDLNLKLIDLMINKIPEESKFCVSYGQLKGCYWTIPATSTQGTTKEGDKDYIVRVSVSPSLDLERHKEVFVEFVNRYIKG